MADRRMRLQLMAVATCCTWFLGCTAPPPKPDPNAGTRYGYFEDVVRTKWLLDGRKMVLLDDVVFHDSADVVWTAPKGAVIDGSSIPKILWSVFTGPYEGRHRDASVTHDYECCVQDRPWRAVHRMFFDAMMARDENPVRAKTMYFAVHHFGPRWPDAARESAFTEADFARAVEYIQAHPEVSLEVIENLQPSQLRMLVPAPSAILMARGGWTSDRMIIPAVRTRPCQESELSP